MHSILHDRMVRSTTQPNRRGIEYRCSPTDSAPRQRTTDTIHLTTAGQPPHPFKTSNRPDDTTASGTIAVRITDSSERTTSGGRHWAGGHITRCNWSSSRVWVDEKTETLIVARCTTFSTCNGIIVVQRATFTLCNVQCATINKSPQRASQASS